MKQFSIRSGNVVSFVILLVVTKNESAPNKKSDHTTAYGLARDKFAELLDIIANVNKERVDLLQRYTALDRNGGHNPVAIDVSQEIYTGNDRSKGHKNTLLRQMAGLLTEYYDDDFQIGSEMKKKLRGQVEDEKGEETLQISKDIGDGRELTKKANESTAGTDKNILRGSCWKKATKRCKKACRAAFKTVCKEYRCRSGMKKMMKRHCKSECKDAFD